MNISSETLKRYLRNFDPLNQSLFKIDRVDSDSSYDMVKTDKYDHTQRQSLENAKFTKHHSINNSIMKPMSHKQTRDSAQFIKKYTDTCENHNQVIIQLKKNLEDSLKREEQLKKQNAENVNKIHALAQHISALQFQNEQISNAIHKSNKLYKSMKVETLRLKKTGTQKIDCFQIQIDSIIDVLNQFMQAFGQVYLKNNKNQSKLCKNFKEMLQQHNILKSKNTPREVTTLENVKKISQFLITLFQQIQFFNQLLEQESQFATKNEQLRLHIEQIQHKQSQLINENKQLKSQIQKLKLDLYSSINPTSIQYIDINEIFNQANSIVKVIANDLLTEECKQQISEYFDCLKQKLELGNNIKSLQKNYKTFQTANIRGDPIFGNSNSKLLANQLKFKKNMIDKQKEEIKKLNIKLDTYYRTISNSVTKGKENLRYQRSNTEFLQNSHQITRNQSQRIHAIFQNQSGSKQNNLFQEIIHSKNEEEISRQNSLVNLKKKIQNAETLTRIISKKTMRPF